MPEELSAFKNKMIWRARLLQREAHSVRHIGFLLTDSFRFRNDTFRCLIGVKICIFHGVAQDRGTRHGCGERDLGSVSTIVIALIANAIRTGV